MPTLVSARTGHGAVGPLQRGGSGRAAPAPGGPAVMPPIPCRMVNSRQRAASKPDTTRGANRPDKPRPYQTPVDARSGSGAKPPLGQARSDPRACRRSAGRRPKLSGLAARFSGAGSALPPEGQVVLVELIDAAAGRSSRDVLHPHLRIGGREPVQDRHRRPAVSVWSRLSMRADEEKVAARTARRGGAGQPSRRGGRRRRRRRRIARLRLAPRRREFRPVRPFQCRRGRGDPAGAGSARLSAGSGGGLDLAQQVG